MQERTESLERELASTSAQLTQLQSMQTAINAKNQMLTKLLQLNGQTDQRSAVELPKSFSVRYIELQPAEACHDIMHASTCPCSLRTPIDCITHTLQTVQDLYKQRGFKSSPDPVFAANLTEPALRLTVWETGEQHMSIHQIGQLELQEFSKVYTVSMLARLTPDLGSCFRRHSSFVLLQTRGTMLNVHCADIALLSCFTTCSFANRKCPAQLQPSAAFSYILSSLICCTCAYKVARVLCMLHTRLSAASWTIQIGISLAICLQAYIHQMAACLAKLTLEEQTEESNTPVMYRVHELVIECSSLLVITLMSNPSMYKDLQHCKFDEGAVCLDAQLPMDCCSVLVSSLQLVDCTGSVTHMLDDLCFPTCAVFCMCCSIWLLAG